VRRYITTYDANKESLDKIKHKKTKHNIQHRPRLGPHIPRQSTFHYRLCYSARYLWISN